MKKLLALLLASVMLLSLAACGGDDGGNDAEKSTYKTAVQIYEKLLNGKSSDLKKSLPSEFWDDLKDTSNMSFSDAKEYFDNMMSSVKSYYGESYSATIEILEEKKTNADELNALINKMMNQYDYISQDSISEAYELQLQMKMTSNMGNEEEEAIFFAAKMGNSWYIIDEDGRFTMDIFNEWG